ncbi:heavy-metal-associated domain-containing protein [Orrella marina]|uniref:Copper chaperone n=1 Tax=Orrella marina TaxID=2163011 RepID=A0A2R4XI78_9BURK|nr:heavy-metal-associated domain-containing protein [Orrella marina]AWB33463.1 copper chaperone [Orrella marina]
MKFHVPDMSCNHCVASITKAIREVSSDAHVVCDLHERIVEVLNLVEKSPQEIIAVLDEVGYEATLIEAQA